MTVLFSVTCPHKHKDWASQYSGRGSVNQTGTQRLPRHKNFRKVHTATKAVRKHLHRLPELGVNNSRLRKIVAMSH